MYIGQLNNLCHKVAKGMCALLCTGLVACGGGSSNSDSPASPPAGGAPTPTPTVSPTPDPMVSPLPTPTVSPTPTPMLSPSPTPTASPLPTPTPSPQIAGTWEVTEDTDSNCGDDGAKTYDVVVSQNQSDITVVVADIEVQASLSGNQLSWSGRYPEDGGTVTAQVTVTITGDSLSGSSTWSWTDGSFSCTGVSSISGQRVVDQPIVLSPPAAPTYLETLEVTQALVRLGWMDNATNEDAFEIERSNTLGDPDFVDFVLVATLRANTQEWEDNTVLPERTYAYRVRAVNSAGASGYWELVTRTPPAPPVSPSAPDNLTATALSSTEVRLNWRDTSDNEDAFVLVRHVCAETRDGMSICQDTELGALAADSTQFIDTGLNPATQYRYTLRARNTAGDSATVNVTVDTLAPPVTLPAAPSNPSISELTSTSVVFSWQDNADNEISYQLGGCNVAPVTITNSLGEDALRCPDFRFVEGGYPANTTHALLTELEPGTLHRIFVRAANSAGTSANVGIEFTTLENPIEITAALTKNVFSSSLDASVAETVYPDNGDMAIGCNFVGSVAGFPSGLCAMSIVGFDLPSLENRSIAQATLTFTTKSNGTASEPWNLTAIGQGWTSSTMNWHAAAALLVYNENQQNGLASPVFPDQEIVLDVTQIVRNWYSGYFQNYGLHLAPAEFSSPFEVILKAFEFYGASDPLSPPTLTIYLSD